MSSARGCPAARRCHLPGARADRSGRGATAPRRALAALLTVALAAACSTPSGRLRALAAEHGFERRSVHARGFELTVFENGPGEPERAAALPADDGARAPERALHVYLEGDGTPWSHRVFVMSDPTPRRPLMLSLMALDEGPSVYIGRPCYNGSALDEGCDRRLWTSARYSETVIASMAVAIRGAAERHGVETIRLFGHSGGGALALLLAAELGEELAVLDVVTVAGNLDTEAWTRHHGYSPLRDSRNPAREPALDERVRQWHLVGGRDTVVPPTLVRGFVERQPAARGVLFPGFTHGCCWERVWRAVLRAVTRADPSVMPGRTFRAPPGKL